MTIVPTGLRAGLLSGVLLLSGGCFLQRKPKVQIPVAVPPAPVASTPVPSTVPEQPAPVQTAPVTPPPTQPTTQNPPATEPAKPSPFPPVNRPPARSTPAVVTPPPVAQPVTPTPAPAPALGAMLSADERKQLEGAYQSDLTQANTSLSRLNGRNLTAEQRDSVSRARAWIVQAAQYRGRDLATAAELVRRARVLTQDLASALK